MPYAAKKCTRDRGRPLVRKAESYFVGARFPLRVIALTVFAERLFARAVVTLFRRAASRDVSETLDNDFGRLSRTSVPAVPATSRTVACTLARACFQTESANANDGLKSIAEQADRA